MRSVLGLLITLLCAGLLCAQSPVSKMTRLERFGQTYISINDWARNNGFTTSWIRRDKELQVNARGMKLQFVVDSRQAEVNDVNVWLSVAITSRDGVLYAGLTDIQTTLNPLVFPPAWKGTAGIRTVCIDPGHGGKDPGNMVGAHLEKTYTLLLAQEMMALLNKAGLKCSLTRSKDVYLYPDERPMVAGNRQADLFVSLHFNSSFGGKSLAKGIEMYCLTPEGAESTNGRGGDERLCVGNRQDSYNINLAYYLQKSLLRRLPVEDRGIRRARFAVLRTATMPAVLIEGGFMTDAVEAERIFDSTYRRRMAQAIVDGLLEYERVMERK